MQETIVPLLTAWENFYVIVGSSAAALTGLQFVVIALISDTRSPGSPEAIDAFGTPTVVHFCAVLLVSAVVSAPWHALTSVATIFGGVGIAGIAYTVVVTRRAHRQSDYKPVFEDWLWHVAIPFVAYAMLLVAAAVLRFHTIGSLFAIGAVTLMLLFTGIHNAWDAVTFIAVVRPAAEQKGLPPTTL